MKGTALVSSSRSAIASKLSRRRSASFPSRCSAISERTSLSSYSRGRSSPASLTASSMASRRSTTSIRFACKSLTSSPCTPCFLLKSPLCLLHCLFSFKSAKNPETRRRAEFTRETQCHPVNSELLEKIILLRQEESSLLGFKNFADYCIAPKMAKTAEKVLLPRPS